MAPRANWKGFLRLGARTLRSSELAQLVPLDPISLDRVRVLQGHGVGALQDAARAITNAQRHDARPARRQDEM